MKEGKHKWKIQWEVEVEMSKREVYVVWALALLFSLSVWIVVLWHVAQWIAS